MKIADTAMTFAMLGLVCAGPALSHHSVTAYDLSKSVTLAGVVKDFQWTNPHSWIDLLVTDPSGKQMQWAIECGTPSVNMRLGWKKSDLHPGDKISLVVHPKRDGTPGGTLDQLTLADGRVIKGPASLFTPPPEASVGGP